MQKRNQRNRNLQVCHTFLLFFFLVENKQKKMKNSEESFQGFKTFHGKNNETNLFEFALFLGEMHGIYISHLPSCVEIY